jgi:hypothetical protein
MISAKSTLDRTSGLANKILGKTITNTLPAEDEDK